MANTDMVIGLGANLGDPVVEFRRALTAMRAWLRVEAVSALYQTQAIGPEQPDFLNAAVRGSSELSPEQVLEALLGIERDAGRVRRERWGPRCLDLDLLWLDGVAVDAPHLVVPHPRMAERAFALIPLLEVAPDARDPRGLRPYREALASVQGQRIVRSSEHWW